MYIYVSYHPKRVDQKNNGNTCEQMLTKNGLLWTILKSIRVVMKTNTKTDKLHKKKFIFLIYLCLLLNLFIFFLIKDCRLKIKSQKRFHMYVLKKYMYIYNTRKIMLAVVDFINRIFPNWKIVKWLIFFETTNVARLKKNPTLYTIFCRSRVLYAGLARTCDATT